jgi:ferredoxin
VLLVDSDGQSQHVFIPLFSADPEKQWAYYHYGFGHAVPSSFQACIFSTATVIDELRNQYIDHYVACGRQMLESLGFDVTSDGYLV